MLDMDMDQATEGTNDATPKQQSKYLLSIYHYLGKFVINLTTLDYTFYTLPVRHSFT